MSNANDPAFPSSGNPYIPAGLTKRELFAAMAMQGICANDNLGDCEPDRIAEWSLRQADALLAELAKEPTQ